MFGTLIVQLPSAYEGGQLRVKHAKKEHTFDFSGLKGSTGFHYVALYADCQHELCAVTKGYRLCLVYNLIHVGSGHCPAPIDDSVLVKRAVDAMKGWIAHPSATEPMIAIPLAHEYCEASLSFSGLKNTDRAMADLLRMATREIEFDLYLCIVKISQQVGGDYGSEYGGFMEVDVIEQKIMAEHLVSPSGKKAESVQLDDEMIKPEGALDNLLSNEPDDEEIEEVTGNEGATMDRWYSQAALLLWPKQHRLEVLGLGTMAKRLSESITKRSPLERNSTKWQKYNGTCQKLISVALSQRLNVEAATTLLFSATALGEYSLVSSLLGSTSASANLPTESVPASSYISSAKFIDALLLACSTFSWNSLQPCLSRLIETGAVHDVESCVQLLHRLVTSQPSLNREQQTMGQELALPICKVLAEEQDIVASRPATSWYWQSQQPISGVRTQDFVCRLLKTLSLLDYTSQSERLLKCFLSLPKRYPLATVLVPAAEELHKWSGKKSYALLGFAALCIKDLEASTKAPIKEPLNWSQHVTITCRCQDCTELQSFFKHPSQTSARFKVKESRRHHLEQQMRASKCDCKHVTEHTGTPRTLVVTKTRRKLAHKKQERESNLQLLSRLKTLYGDISEPSAKRPRLIDLTKDH